MKVTDDFRVTDLQALAYAGAYAKRGTEQLARTLRHHLNKEAELDAQAGIGSGHLSAESDAPEPGADPVTPGATADHSDEVETASETSEHSLDDAKTLIAEFLQLDDFKQWHPSQHVRIKLIAPDFPRRVLQTVKWLGDVYDMPIEAINVRLFEAKPGLYSIAFERLLPLPAEHDFDMTVREQEDRQREANVTRRPAALPLLVKNGVLKNGQRLWLVKSAMTKKYADLYDPNNPAFQVRVHAPGGSAVKLAWRPNEGADEELLAPSLVAYRVWATVIPGYESEEWTSPVATSFAIEPGGKTLDQLAEETGAW